jgi:hypothetical protein
MNDTITITVSLHDAKELFKWQNVYDSIAKGAKEAYPKQPLVETVDITFSAAEAQRILVQVSDQGAHYQAVKAAIRKVLPPSFAVIDGVKYKMNDLLRIAIQQAEKA